MKDEEIIKGWDNFTTKLKSMSKADWVHTLVVYLMIIMLCICFYALGYGKSYQNTVEIAKKIVTDLIEQNNVKIINQNPQQINGFFYNITTGKVEVVGG